MKSVFFFLLLLTFFAEGSYSSQTAYPQFCRQAAENDQVFANFKRHPSYIQIVGVNEQEIGQLYLETILRKSPDWVPFFDHFRRSDRVGNPFTYDYKQYGRFSPTTLRYINVASDLREKFGDTSNMHIVEIGGGFGGQCKILAETMGFASYIIIDLPEVNALIKKCLALFNVENVYFIDSNNVPNLAEPYDLLISNYAFSEVESGEQQKYLDKVILTAKRGYMIMNFITPQAMSLDQLLSVFKQRGRSIRIEGEEPLTYHTNLLLVWE